MDFSKYTFQPSTHRGKKIIMIKFPFDVKLKHAMRKRFSSAKWSASKKTWYLPDLPSVRRELNIGQHNALPDKTVLVHPENRHAYNALNEQLKLKVGERKINGKINAVKFYFEQVLHQPKMFFDIPRPKKALKLPKMLSKSEVKKIFKNTNNLNGTIKN